MYNSQRLYCEPLKRLTSLFFFPFLSSSFYFFLHLFIFFCFFFFFYNIVIEYALHILRNFFSRHRSQVYLNVSNDKRRISDEHFGCLPTILHRNCPNLRIASWTLLDRRQLENIGFKNAWPQFYNKLHCLLRIVHRFLGTFALLERLKWHVDFFIYIYRNVNAKTNNYFFIKLALIF